jgi:hypothetical protein
MDYVSFITVEDDDDLIVSFAIPEDDPGDVRSLTLLRTPRYEPLLDPSDRGVTVSDDSDTDDSFLVSAKITERVATITTRSATYELDISQVDREELGEAAAILRKMNFDGAFELALA